MWSCLSSLRSSSTDYTLRGEAGVGRRLAEFVLSVLESTEGRQTLTGLIRAAASEEQAARLIRELVTDRLLTPLAERVGSDHPDLRAGLIASQIVGLTMTRHIVGLNHVVSAPAELLVGALAPVFEHYLNGELDNPPAEHEALPNRRSFDSPRETING